MSLIDSPYYESDDVRIYCGDSLEIMREIDDKSFDVTVTSPPYNQLGASKPSGMFKADLDRGGTDSIRRLRDMSAYEDKDDRTEEGYQNWQREIIAELVRLTRGTVWYNHKLRYRDGVAIYPTSWIDDPIWAEVIWDRGGSFMLNANRFAESNERIYGIGSPVYWDDTCNTYFTTWRISPTAGKVHKGEHPCSYPTEIVMRLLRATCPPGGMVIDPFLGSGTTAIVARVMGRKCVGIDQEERWCELAAKNVENAHNMYEWDQAARFVVKK